MQEYPTTVVVPLSKGQYFDTSKFRVADASGNTLPAQFDVLNKWWADDNSIRHLKIEFQPTINAFTTSNTGISTYYLKDDGNGNNIQTSLKVDETTDYITVNTGTLKFTINKKNFNIIDEAWLDLNSNSVFEAEEQVIKNGANSGGIFTGRLQGDIQYDASRSDITFAIEESGPMRTVIKAQALTKYYSTDNHQHGFAVRIYAYANKPYIKIDYQLQNSAKNVKWSWPLYFEAMNINLDLNINNPTIKIDPGDGSIYQKQLDSGLVLKQKMHNQADIHDLTSDGILDANTFANDWLSNNPTSVFLDISDNAKGIMVTTRNFWQTFPNGLAISNNKLNIQLWPDWSCHWEDEDGTFVGGAGGKPCDPTTAAGLYWLEDMQHTYKEVFLYFHKGNTLDADLKNFARTSQYHPVAVVPTSQYQRARATLDMGGMIPINQPVSGADERRFIYSSDAFNTAWNQYKFGWDNFYFYDKIRKSAPATGGGWPSTSAYFIASGNPDDYYSADVSSMAETNIMPQSMAGYVYEIDYPSLGLAQRYEGQSWRAPKDPPWDVPYIYPTWNMKKPRDDQHGWFYFIEEAYYFTANPWIKDWYKFINEFRKPVLDSTTSGDISSRGAGNMLSNALQAYRVTGDKSILDKIRNYVNNQLRARQDSRYGFKNSLDGGNQEAGMQAGYLLRAVISYMEEIKDSNPQAYAEAFQFVSGYMEWNYKFSHFSYYLDASSGQIGTSDGTSLTFVDPQAWYYLRTGKQKYLDHLNQYINTGINGGSKPYGSHTSWYGQWEGRYSTYVRTTTKPDTTPPAKINDLTAAKTGTNTVKLVWTAPQDASRYHIVYSDKPISEVTTTDTTKTNWWAAKAIGPSLVANPGKEENIIINVDENFAKYFAIFSFDENDNMNEMSNVAPVLNVIDRTPPSIPQGLTAIPLSDTQIDISWQPSQDPESGISKYIIYRAGIKIGETATNIFTDTGLSELTTYTYEINAVNGAGLESSKSNILSTITKADTAPPTLTLAAATGEPNKVNVIFNEPVEQTSAQNPADYQINNNMQVYSANLEQDLKTVKLTTSAHITGVTYTLTVNNVKDRAKTPNTITIPISKSYIYDSGLVTYWKFDEGVGETTTDYSGNNHGTLYNAPAWTKGFKGQSLSFGGNNYVRGSQTLNLGEVTISAWVKITSIPSTNQMIIGFLNGLSSSTHDKELFIDTAAKLRFYVYSGGEKTTPAPAQPVPLNEWVFVAATADGINAKTYVNGIEDATVPISGPTFSAYTLPNVFVSGDNFPPPDLTFFNGIIDEVRIYNRALSVSEIQALFNVSEPPTKQGDVNNDKAVDILDVQALVNHILGIQDYGTSADVNNDSSVDVLDVQEVVNIILGG